MVRRYSAIDTRRRLRVGSHASSIQWSHPLTRMRYITCFSFVLVVVLVVVDAASRTADTTDV